jgi:hypothetical protein
VIVGLVLLLAYDSKKEERGITAALFLIDDRPRVCGGKTYS